MVRAIVKFQFSTKTLLLLTGGIVFVILDLQLWFRWNHLLTINSTGKDAQEKMRLEAKLGYLSVREPRASFYVAVPCFEPMKFVTKIYIARDHRVRKLILSMKPNGANSTQWSQWEKSFEFAIDWTGHRTVTVEVKKLGEDLWNVVIQDGDSIWEIPLDPALTNFLEPGDNWSRTVWFQDFLAINPRSFPSAIKLLAIDAVPVQALPTSFHPTNGLHIWIE